MQRGTDIAKAADVLRRGGLVAFPTETVYGLGADASSAQAIAKIYAAKGRPADHPVIVHVGAGADLAKYAANVPEAARVLAAELWPGPLTMIVRRGAAIAPDVSGGGDTVGLRMPSHPLAQALLQAFGGAVAAPSANRFGHVSPTTADHVVADLGDDVDYVLDGGKCEVGVESTIVDFSRGRPVLLRPGGMPREAIEAIIGPLDAADANAPAAPGTLASHYAPRAEVIACELDEVPAMVARAKGGEAAAAGDVPRERKVAILAPRSAFTSWPNLDALLYPLPDDLAGMAHDLYAALRDLDAKAVDVVIAALPPAVGLGEAVGDRLRRAAGPRGSQK